MNYGNLPMIRFIILILFPLLIQAQSKYFIYFTDKGVDSTFTITKTAPYFLKAVNSLSARSIERRIKHLGEENFISFTDLPLEQNYVRQIESLGIRIIHKLKWFNAVSAYLTEDQKKEISVLNFVESIEPVRTVPFRNKNIVSEYSIIKQPEILSVFDYGNSFGQLNLSGIPEVHSAGISGEDIIIGILDTGFDWKDHESLLNAEVLAEYDFIFNDNNTANEPEDNPSQHFHGTSVFSIVGGFSEGNLIGSAFGSSFLLAKTEDVRSETHVEEDNYAAALEWMDSIGVDITTSSLGYSEFDDSTYSYTYQDMDGKSTIITRAAELAFQKGIVVISSAGNEGDDPWFHITAPADGFNVIAVGSSNPDSSVSNFSGRGPTFDGRIKPDVLAQGTSVWAASASGFNSYGYISGTSAAAPIVSGAAALLLSAYPHLKNTQIRSILLETAGNSGFPDNERGYGLLNASDALSFPNLELNESSYLLHKIFINHDSILPSSVKLIITGDEIREIIPGFDGELIFTADLPVYSPGSEVSFYFTYQDSTGKSYREPEEKNYKFIYGDLNISLHLPLSYSATEPVSELYPNPFIHSVHSNVKLNILSEGNDLLQMMIIDAAGEKVKEINLITEPGLNMVSWDGYSDRGYLCASGVYYFLIKLGGDNFGRKLVFLK